MLKQTELQDIREQLEMAQNPLFFFDNDVDGLCSFLILRRGIGRGRGIPIKSFPDLKEQYFKKVQELNPDAVFILDKAEVSREFIDSVYDFGIPIIWIDHHESLTSRDLIEKTSYYNSMPSGEPVTYVSQRIFNRKEDLWLAVIGCISDVYKPDFAKVFSKENPELYNYNLSAFDALNATEIGKISRMLNFGLMDTVTNVVKLIKYLFKAKNVYDLLEENNETKQFHRRYSQLNEFFKKQLDKASEKRNDNSPVLFFTYTGETSMSAEIANKLYYENKDKLIVVGFKRPEKVNISIRGKDALKITKKSIEDIDGATGGGHEEATGAMVPIDDWENFKKNISNEVNKL